MEKGKWIKFNGGKCPVSNDSMVVIKMKHSGYTMNKAMIFMLPSGEWSYDIEAYMIIDEYKAPRKKIVFENENQLIEKLLTGVRLYTSEYGSLYCTFDGYSDGNPFKLINPDKKYEIELDGILMRFFVKKNGGWINVQ